MQSFVVADARAFQAALPEVPIGLLDVGRPTEAELLGIITDFPQSLTGRG
ncbi:hypothetical protein [Jiangella alba]|nr:hypothetical protein [Jiangella alba]